MKHITIFYDKDGVVQTYLGTLEETELFINSVIGTNWHAPSSPTDAFWPIRLGTCNDEGEIIGHVYEFNR